MVYTAITLLLPQGYVHGGCVHHLDNWITVLHVVISKAKSIIQGKGCLEVSCYDAACACGYRVTKVPVVSCVSTTTILSDCQQATLKAIFITRSELASLAHS